MEVDCLPKNALSSIAELYGSDSESECEADPLFIKNNESCKISENPQVITSPNENHSFVERIKEPENLVSLPQTLIISDESNLKQDNKVEMIVENVEIPFNFIGNEIIPIANSLNENKAGEISRNFIQDEKYRVDIRNETSSEDSESSSDEESNLISTSESESESELELDDESVDEKTKETNKKTKMKKTAKGEFDNLPPIENLEITVDEVRLDPLGEIAWTVEQMVVVKPKGLKPTLNLDTILFIERGKRALGRIFDVFGSVNDPHYCVRFNSTQHIVENNIRVGMSVYYCPNSEHTSLVFLTDLIKCKATEDVAEEEHPVFSDDEEEISYFAALKQKKLNSLNVQNQIEIPAKRVRKNDKQGWKGKHPWNNNQKYNYNHFYNQNQHTYGYNNYGINYNYVEQPYSYQQSREPNFNWNINSTFPPTQGQPWQMSFPPTLSITTPPPPPPPPPPSSSSSPPVAITTPSPSNS